MNHATKRSPKLSGARTKTTIAEARAVLDVMGYNQGARYEELAGVVQGLAIELKGNKEFSDLYAFFNLAARAFEANIIRRFARDVAQDRSRGNEFQNNAKEADKTRETHMDFTVLQAKMYVSISELNRAKRHALFLRARDTLAAMRTEVKVTRATGKIERKNDRAEREIQSALKFMRALNPGADPAELEKTIRETMKPA